MEPQKPSLGRIVIYYCPDNDPRAAMIVCVRYNGSVNLTVHDEDGHTFGITCVPHVGALVAGDTRPYWNWPPRV